MIMKEKINIAKILKDKPRGTKLYSSACGKCELKEADDKSFKVSFYSSKSGFMIGGEGTFDKNGNLYDDGECIVFPSKEMRNWRKFSWKKDDVLVSKDNVYIIFEKFEDDTYTRFKGKHYLWKEYDEEDYNKEETKMLTSVFEKATDDVAQTYIKTIEEHLDGKLNLETLEIEKQLEFKIGDILFVKYNNRNIIFILSNINGKFYNHRVRLDSNKVIINYSDSHFQNEGIEFIRYATEEEKQQLFDALAKEGKHWDAEKKQIVDLKPKYEFKPMDLCLMKYIGKYNNRGWELCQYAYTEHRVSSSGEQRDFYHAVGGEIYAECIPYKGNEHLLGTKKSK